MGINSRKWLHICQEPQVVYHWQLVEFPSIACSPFCKDGQANASFRSISIACCALHYCRFKEYKHKIYQLVYLMGRRAICCNGSTCNRFSRRTVWYNSSSQISVKMQSMSWVLPDLSYIWLQTSGLVPLGGVVFRVSRSKWEARWPQAHENRKPIKIYYHLILKA